MNIKLKKFIITQLSSYTKDTNIDERVELFCNYLDVLCKKSLTKQDFVMLKHKLEEIAEADYLDCNALEQALSIEPFLRELYCLETGEHNQVPFTKVIISLDVIPTKWLSHDCDGWTFSTSIENSDNKNYFKKIFTERTTPYSFANMYNCRNMKAHTLNTLSLLDRATLFIDILNSFVTSTWNKRLFIRSYIDSVNVNINQYFEKIKSDYKKNKNYISYIPPKGKVRLQYASSTENEERDIFDFYDECQSVKRLKIVGKAGMGKTTAIYELINYDIMNYNKNHRVPVLIELIDISDLSSSIESYIASILNISVEKTEELLEDGKISLYLDGLNEITLEDSLQKILLRKIMNFIERYEKSFIILSNRENNHIEVMNGEPVYYVLPLNNRQIDDFINKNLPQKSKCFGKDLKRQLENYPEILESARTPYMLKQLIDTVIATNGHIPEKPGEITGCLLKAIINREIYEKKELLAVHVEEFLKQIAEEFIDDENIGLSEIKIRQIMAKAIDKKVLPVKKEDIAKVLSLLLEMGILRKNKDHISFMYPDYREFYFMAALDD